jgi:thioredoxin 1
MTTKPDAVPVIVTDATFRTMVMESLLPVLLDMWAPWSQLSLELAPVLDQIASELAGKVKVAKLDIDDNPNTAVDFGVRSIPTIIIFKDGVAIERLAGPQSKAALLDKLKAVTG